MGTGRLPNLLVVGVPKAGTGSLFAYLTQHRDVCGADEKEVGYFNFYNPQRYSGDPPPVESYRAHFAHCAGERYAVEATPTYSYGGRPVITAVRSVLSSPKIILSLRDPVDRLWSAYTFQRALGNITGLRSFDEYLRICERRRQEGSPLVPRDHLHGLHIGFYADYLDSWLEEFGSDLRVVFAEELSRDALHVMADTFRWLDLDPEVAPSLDLATRNPTRHPRSPAVAKLVYSVKRAGDQRGLLPAGVRAGLRRAYLRVNAGERPEQMDPSVRQHVKEIYRESNQKTAQALTAHGYQDLPEWLQAASHA